MNVSSMVKYGFCGKNAATDTLKATALSRRVKVIVILVLTSNSEQSLETPKVRKDRRQKTIC